MADVTINYKGSAIATMSASGTKTLETEGKYCEDDIEVVYVSPGGGSTLGTKVATANGTYYASDDSLDGYSQVTVSVSGGGSYTKITGTITGNNAVTYTVTDLPGTPKKVFICIHDPSTNAFDGTTKGLAAFYLDGICGTVTTNSAGTGTNTYIGTAPADWFSGGTVAADGTVATSTGQVVITTTGFSVKMATQWSYAFRKNYTWDYEVYY